MKKMSILSVLSFLSVSIIHAQIQKGTWLVGGNVSFYSSHTNSEGGGGNYKQDAVTLSPAAGKAIKDNLVFGGSLVFYYSNSDMPQLQAWGYGAGIFLRKYKSLGKEFYLFLEEALNGRYDKSEYTSPALNNYKRTYFGLNVNPGIAYTVSRRLQLEAGFSQILSIYFSREKGDKSSTDNLPYTNNTFNLSSSLSNNLFQSAFVGARILLHS